MSEQVSIEWWLAVTIQLCRLQVQREREKIMTPKLRGVLQSYKMLAHNLDSDADELATRIQTADQRRQVLKGKAHSRLDEANTGMGDIESFLDELEGANGGELGNSSNSSAPRSSDLTQKR